MGNQYCIPSTPSGFLRVFRFGLAMIVAIALGSSFKNGDAWSLPMERAAGFMMFIAVVTTIYDTYTYLFSVPKKLSDCTTNRRYKFVHAIIEGLLVIFWWAAIGAVATALQGMFTLDKGGDVVLKRRGNYDDGYWKPEGGDSGAGEKPTPTQTVSLVPTLTQSIIESITSSPLLTNVNPSPQQNGGGQKDIDWDEARRGKGLVVGGVSCAGLVG
ncbi:hypothetical protein DFH27DRAFT_522975 [Peziza echinospora]|nr:hypothetical protein DFH27DRAFT_522975 [Peziza echinospora]